MQCLKFEVQMQICNLSFKGFCEEFLSLKTKKIQRITSMKCYCMELALEKANKPVFGSFLFFISKCSLYPTFTFARVPLY